MSCIPFFQARLFLLVLICALASSAQYTGISAKLPTGSRAIFPNGLVASFDMQTLNSGGHLRDFSGKGNDGTFTRARLVNGLFGKARHFSSVKDRVSLASNRTLDLKGPLSIAVWVRVRTLGLHQHIVACDNRFALWFTDSNQLRFVNTLADGVQTRWQAKKDRWFSLVGVFRGTEGDTLSLSNISVYVDGQPVETALSRQVWEKGSLFPTDACFIGFESHQGNPSHKNLLFSGDIDELLIFNRALTESEVRAHAKRVAR